MSSLAHLWRAMCRYIFGAFLDPLEREARYIFVTCTPAHADQHSAEHAANLSDMPGMRASTARAAAPQVPHPQALCRTTTHQSDVVCGRCSPDEPQHVSDGEVLDECVGGGDPLACSSGGGRA
jgi:hypothetical protein